MPTFQRWIRFLYGYLGLTRGVGRAVKILARLIPGLQHYEAQLVDSRVLTLDLRQTMCLPYFLSGTIWEEEGETLLARTLLAPGDHAVDIGANVGWYTTLFAECVGPSGKVLAFEPHPVAFGLLETTCRSYPQVSPVFSAVSDRKGTVGLVIPHDGGQTRIVEASGAGVTVPATTLDGCLAKSDLEPLFVKCDIEGAELKMLRGAKQLLESSAPPIWMVELDARLASRFGHHPRDVVRLFIDLGYRAFRIHSQDCRLVDVPSEFTFRFDAVFVPQKLMSRVEGLLSTSALVG